MLILNKIKIRESVECSGVGWSGRCEGVDMVCEGVSRWVLGFIGDEDVRGVRSGWYR